MTEIRNTTADMNAPDGLDALLLLATGLATGSPDEFIGAQEKAGQRQLVASQSLPTDTHGTDREFEAFGFVFGDPDPHDPMFRPATLPAGWSKRGSDHDMWSYVVDELGRDRVGVFYKSAFYDRRAHMSLTTVYGYLCSCVYDGRAIVSDETWATPAALRKAALDVVASSRETVVLYERRAGGDSPDAYAVKRLAEAQSEIARYTAIAEWYGAGAGRGEAS